MTERPRPLEHDDRDPAPPRRPGRHVPEVTPAGLEDALAQDALAQDAPAEEDRPVAPSAARAALAHPVFRLIWFGSLLSNIGTWMQNITLGVFAFQLTQSETFVSWVTFAQLGPLLVFTLVGGTLADLLDRRRLLLLVAVEQLVLSIVLAWVVSADSPARSAILLVVLGIGIGQAVHAPTFTSVLPSLVPRRDLPGAVSLQSVNMNASRVVGPAIGGVVLGSFGIPAVFLLNAASYLFVVAVLVKVRFPAVEAPPEGAATRGLRRVLAGFAVARRDRVVGSCLVTMALFSFFSLPIVTQLAPLAETNLGIDGESTAFGLLYATFAFGALLGALSIGTFLAGASLPKVVRVSLVGFAAAMTTLSLLRSAAPAYPVGLVMGFCYFATVTSLSTVLQTRLADHERGRVMALWIMAFGGTVPVGALAFGPAAEATSLTAMMLVGAAVALVLALVTDLREPADAA
jgi:MFS family permease